MSDEIQLVDLNLDNLNHYPLCGYKNGTTPALKGKRQWLKERLDEGFGHRLIISEADGAVGGIEFGPARFSWRPVKAEGYLFVSCIYIMKKKYKGSGWGKRLLESVIRTARENGYAGIVGVCRKGTWMAGPALFESLDFQQVDSARPDFRLMALSFSKKALQPQFIDNSSLLAEKYSKGLFILTSSQCPYLLKSVPEMVQAAEEELEISPELIHMETSLEARKNPSPFGVFSVLLDGKILIDSPCSKTRFLNVLRKELD